VSTTSRAGSRPASTALTDRHEPDTQISARSTILLSVRACKRRPRHSGLIKMLTNGQSSVASNQSLRPSIAIAPEAPDRPHPRGFLHWRLSDDGPSARDKRVRWAVLRNPSQRRPSGGPSLPRSPGQPTMSAARGATTVTNARGSRTPITGPTCRTTRLAGRRPSIEPGFPQGLDQVTSVRFALERIRLGDCGE
jgi:hypothetical protein